MQHFPGETLTENVPSPLQYFDIDMSAKLFKSRRMYAAPVQHWWVVFNPDREGLPILISQHAYKLLNSFHSGKTAGAALLETMAASELDFGSAVQLIDYFERKGFLRGAPTPERYTATNFPEAHPSSLSIWFHINNHCNLDCEYCFVDKFESTMSDEVIRQSVNSIASTVNIYNIKSVQLKFAGGEPTLSLARAAAVREMLAARLEPYGAALHSGFISNGTIVNRRLIEFLKSTKSGIAISLDGFGEEGHDIYRRYKGTEKGSWKKISTNIDRLISEGIRPSINATISEQSCDTLPRLAEWVVEKGLRIRLSVVRQPSNTWLPGKSREREYEKMIVKLRDSFEATFEILERPEYFIDLTNGLDICELHFATPATTACCGIGNSHIVIQDDGRIASCPMTIREMSAVPASDDLVLSARQTVKYWDPSSRNASPEANCLDCQWFPVCVSGCPVTNERMKGTPFTMSPLHSFYEYVIPRYVQFYGKKLFQATDVLRLNELHVIDSESFNAE